MSAKVAELVDALDLGSSGATRESSSLSFRTRSGSEIRPGSAPALIENPRDPWQSCAPLRLAARVPGLSGVA